jgi:hypothetical protein
LKALHWKITMQSELFTLGGMVDNGNADRNLMGRGIFIIAVSYDYSHAYDQFKSTNLKFNYCFNSNIKLDEQK